MENYMEIDEIDGKLMEIDGKLMEN